MRHYNKQEFEIRKRQLESGQAFCTSDDLANGCVSIALAKTVRHCGLQAEIARENARLQAAITAENEAAEAYHEAARIEQQNYDNAKAAATVQAQARLGKGPFGK